MAVQPRSLSQIRRQIASLSIVRGVADQYGTPDFPSRMGMRTLEYEERRMQQELLAAEFVESGFDAQLELDGDPVIDHLISTKFFSALLVGFQDTVYSLSLATPGDTNSSLIPGRMPPQDRLFLAPIMLSSFGARFRLSSTETEHGPLEPPVTLALDLMGMLLDGSEEPDLSVVPLTNPHVRAYYTDLMSLIAREGAELTYRTRGYPFGVHLSAQEARDRVKWLGLPKTETQIISVTGQLTGGSIETGRFEIKSDGEIISGTATEGASLQLEGAKLGSEVAGEIEVSTIHHGLAETGSRVSYRLTELRMSTSSQPGYAEAANGSTSQRGQ